MKTLPCTKWIPGEPVIGHADGETLEGTVSPHHNHARELGGEVLVRWDVETYGPREMGHLVDIGLLCRPGDITDE